MKNKIKKLNILFICKYNRFRSRIAEAYFRKINKNKNIKAKSAGAIKGNPITKDNISLAKEFGLDIRGKTKGLSSKLLIWQDIAIIVADDVPLSLINNKKYNKKLVVWEITDVKKQETKYIKEKRIRMIMKKVDNLNKQLKKAR